MLKQVLDVALHIFLRFLLLYTVRRGDNLSRRVLGKQWTSVAVFGWDREAGTGPGFQPDPPPTFVASDV